MAEQSSPTNSADSGAPNSPGSSTNHGKERERKRSRSGCLVCKVRKVKCDERPNSCSNCLRLEIECPGYHATRTELKNPEEVVSAIFARAGRKRRKMTASCTECRIAKSKCSTDRPTCERCRKRNLSCVYDGPPAEEGSQTLERVDNGRTITMSVNRGSWADTVLSRRSSSTEEPGSARRMSSMAEVSMMDAIESTEEDLEPDPLGWLLAPNLPDEPEYLRYLVTTYFTDVHPLRCLSFLHKPSFMKAFDEGVVEQMYGKPLLLAVCALAANVIYWAEDTRTNVQPATCTPGEQWVKQAQQLIFSELNKISVENLMAAVLLCEFYASSPQAVPSFMVSAYAVRAAQALLLDMEHESDQSDTTTASQKQQTTAEFTTRESKRRLMWSVYLLDLQMCSGVLRLSLIDPENIKIQLPCLEQNYNLQIPCTTEGLTPSRVGTVANNMGLEAYYVRVVHIRGKILRQIRQRHARAPPWSPSSEFQKLTSELETWLATLPPTLHLTPTNLYSRRELGQLAALFALHIMYHQTFCDLYRICLPGYRFPAAASFDGVPKEMLERCQATCNEHSVAISDILEMAFKYGKKSLVDTLGCISAFESARHQIVYLVACSPVGNRRNLWSSTGRRLVTNVKSLEMLRGLASIADDCLASIHDLLASLNLSNILKSNTFNTAATTPTAAGEMVPKDLDNLHPFAPYRLVRESISGKRPSPPSNVNLPLPISRPPLHAQSEMRTTIPLELRSVSGLSTPYGSNTPPSNQDVVSTPDLMEQQQTAPTSPLYAEYDAFFANADVDFRRVASENRDLLLWDPMFVVSPGFADGYELSLAGGVLGE